MGSRRDSPIWKWAGIEKPDPPEDPDLDAIVEPIGNLLRRMGTQANRKEMFAYGLANALRSNYGLNTGRHTYSESNVADGESLHEIRDPQSDHDLEASESRLDIGTIRSRLPPKQKEAVDIYLEADKQGVSFADVCRERRRDPNVVRNNLSAVRKKMAKMN